MIGVSEKNNPTYYCACSADSSPNCISCAKRNAFHRLRDTKEAEYNEDDCDDTWNNFAKALTELERNRKTDLKEACKQ